MALAVLSLLFFAPRGVYATNFYLNAGEVLSATSTIVAGHIQMDGTDYRILFDDCSSIQSWYTGQGATQYNFYGSDTGAGGVLVPNMTAYLCTFPNGGKIIAGSLTYFQANGYTDLAIAVAKLGDTVSHYVHVILPPSGAPTIEPPTPPTTQITSISPQLTDPFTQTATTSVTYYITPADLAAGTTTLSYVITTQDSIGYAPAQIGTITATSSGYHTNTFYMGTVQAAWSAYYTLSGVAGQDPNIGAFYSIATTTFWVNGTSPYLNITLSTSTGTTTNGSSLQQCKYGGLLDFSYFACEIGNRISDVFQWLFLPPVGSLNQYQSFQTTISTKMPFGYFVLIKNAIQGINATSTSVFTLTLDQGVLTGIITPLRTALSWILLMGFGFWFYMRMKHLDIW